MSEFPHLSPSTAKLLELDDEARVRRCQEKRFISYARAKLGLEKLQRLLHLPRQTRPEALIVEAPTANGKSYLLKQFRQRNRALDNPEGDRAVVPVLFVEIGGDPSLDGFYESILDALAASYNPRSHRREKRRQAMELLAGVGTRVLLVDEVHNLALATFAEKMRILAEFRAFMNDERLCLSLVCAGTNEAKAELQSDTQLLNRYEVLQLPLWNDGEEYRALLAGFEMLLPLRRASNLWDDDAAAHWILERSDRLIGQMFIILSRAAELAIRTGEERITRSLLERIDYQSPSRRRVPVVDLDPI
ncbi:MAG TPA: TniB family NTP-binding protein [Azospirillaceae bacterium]|nr:TniB family NTP-binding protein [Azospirillaceae bacterium]